MDCRFQLAQIKIQVGDSQIKMTKMEDELSSVKEQNNILLFQIQQMQETPKHPRPKQQIVVVAPTKYVQGAPVLNNQLVPQPTPKLKYSKRRPKPKPEPGQPVGEEVEEVESLEDISVDPEDIIEQVERKSMDLLEAIQNSEQCVVSISGDKDKGKDGELLEGMDVASRKAKAAVIIKLYCDLQRSIRDSFNDMITQLQVGAHQHIVANLGGGVTLCQRMSTQHLSHDDKRSKYLDEVTRCWVKFLASY